MSRNGQWRRRLERAPVARWLALGGALHACGEGPAPSPPRASLSAAATPSGIDVSVVVDKSQRCEDPSGTVEVRVGEEVFTLPRSAGTCTGVAVEHVYWGNFPDPGGRVEGRVTLRGVIERGRVDEGAFAIPDRFELEPVPAFPAGQTIDVSWSPPLEPGDYLSFRVDSRASPGQTACSLTSEIQSAVSYVEPGRGLPFEAISGRQSVAFRTAALALVNQPGAQCSLRLEACRRRVDVTGFDVDGRLVSARCDEATLLLSL